MYILRPEAYIAVIHAKWHRYIERLMQQHRCKSDGVVPRNPMDEDYLAHWVLSVNIRKPIMSSDIYITAVGVS